MKYSMFDYCNGECTKTEFYGQFDLIKPELGKIYRQVSDSWAEKHFKIIFVDNKIALGVSVYNQISNKYIGEHELFYVDTGFKYNDIRPNYRLVSEAIK